MNLALLAAAATGVQVGAATVASRFVLTDVPPLTLALLRYAIGVLCLLPFVMLQLLRDRRQTSGPVRPAPAARCVLADWLVMAALGIGQFGLLIAALNYGLQHVTAARAALIFSLFPLLTLLLSARLGRERITPRLLGGVLLSICGVALALWPTLATPGGGQDWRGELAVLASAGIGAVCSVFYRPYLQRYPTLHVSSLAMLASVLFLALAALPEAWPARLATLSTRSWSIVFFIGLSSALGYFWWLYALKHEPATRVTVFLALNPVTAAVLGQLALAEAVDRWTAGAIVLIAAGLWLATRGAQSGARR